MFGSSMLVTALAALFCHIAATFTSTSSDPRGGVCAFQNYPPALVGRSLRSIVGRGTKEREKYHFPAAAKFGRSHSPSGVGVDVDVDVSANARSSSNPSAKSSARRRRKKTVADRTPEQVAILAQDIIRALVDAGPRAGPTRTFQAYLAVLQTARELMPRPGNAAGLPDLPKILRTLFEKLGATYIKLGQFIASSPTLFPKEYVVEFQKCLDRTDPMDWRTIKPVIESELGGPLSKFYSYVDPKPLASASIAQVHAATLLSGQDVVIKVQKPGIAESLKADLGFIYVASRVLEFVQPDWERTSLSAIAGDIKTSMLEELDFQKEARNIEEFRAFLARNRLLNDATAPKVYRELTTKKVFTMERLDGISMLDEETLARVTRDPDIGQQAIVTALNIWTMSVQQMSWFHADVHAGNLLLLTDGRVGFIDFGIVGQVSERTFQAINDLSMALALGDYTGMAKALCNMGATDDNIDTVQFGKDIEAVMKRIAVMQPNVMVNDMNMANVDDTEISSLLLELVNVTEDNGLKLPREFGLLVKQSLYFDRYLKILAPGLDVMRDTQVSSLGNIPPEATAVGVPTAGVGPYKNGVIDV